MVEHRLDARPGPEPGTPIGPHLRRIWVWHRLHPKSSAYHVVRVLRLDGVPDLQALAGAARDVAQRHEGLRAFFRESAPGEPELHVSPEAAVVVLDEYLDPSGPGDPAAAIDRLVREPFELSAAPLWRLGVVRSDERGSAWLVLVLHHLIADLRTSDIVLQEVADQYGAATTGDPSAMVCPPPSLIAHERHERSQMSAARWTADLAWWRTRLIPVEPARPLPLTSPVDPVRDAALTEVCTTQLTPDDTAAVDSLRRARRITAASLGIAVTAAVLQSWDGDESPQTVGIPSARLGRSVDDDLVGFRLDTLLLPLSPGPEMTVAALCRQVLERYVEAVEHSSAPVDEVLRHAMPGLSGGPAALIRVWFNDLTAAHAPARMGDLSAQEHVVPPPGALFDLNLYLWRTSDGCLQLQLVTPAGHIAAGDAQSLLEQVRGTLVCAARNPDLSLREAVRAGCQPAGPNSLRELGAPVADVLPITAPGGSDQRAEDPVRRWATLTPHAVALSDADGVLDYRELDAAVDVVASALDEACGLRVAVPARRDRTFVTRLLGARRAGAVPVLVDASWPRRRREIALDAAEADWHFPWAGDDGPAPLEPGRHDRPAAGHVLFTSGTTGRPLAVIVDEHVLDRELDRLIERFAILPADRSSFLSGPAHDVAFRDVLLPLRAGGSVHIPPDAIVRDPGACAAWLTEQQISVVNGTPALLALVYGLATSGTHAVRLVISGGAPLAPATAALVRERAPQATIVNGYGCTETPQLVTAEVVEPHAALPVTTFPVGGPLAGRSVLVTTREGHPTPVGVPGEVVVGAPGIAAGYVGGGPAGRFVQDGPARLFRTGDVGRWDSAGRLHLQGRADRQILVHGHRVSLDDVEAVAGTVPGVLRCVAATGPGPGGTGTGPLMLWIELRPGATVEPNDVRTHLSQFLPAPSVPERVVVVDRLEATENHKLVPPRASAPPVPRPSSAAHADVLDPRVVAAAESLLSTTVDPDQGFFAAGFTSLSLLQLAAELERVLDKPVPAVAPFQYPTLRSLARHLAVPTSAAAPAGTTERGLASRREEGEAPDRAATRARRRAVRRALHDDRP